MLRTTIPAGLLAAALSALVLPVAGTSAAGTGAPRLVFDKPPAFVVAGSSAKIGGTLVDADGNPVAKNTVLVGVKDAKGSWGWGRQLSTDAKGHFTISAKASTDPDGYRLVATTISPSGDVDTAAEFLPWVPVTYPVTVTVGTVPTDGGPVPLVVKTADCEGVPLQVQLRASKDAPFETAEETTSCQVGAVSVPLGNPGPGTYEVRVLRPRTSEMTTESVAKPVKLVIRPTDPPTG